MRQGINKYMKVDGFLNADDKQSETPSHPIASNIEPGPFEKFYHIFNKFVLICHLICFIATIICIETKFNNIHKDHIFVSPKVDLRWTNHALVYVDSTENKCEDVTNSVEFQLTIPGKYDLDLLSNGLKNKIHPRRPFTDFMPRLYSFKDKDVIRYNKPGAQLHTAGAMAAFFALSILFQFFHQKHISQHRTRPRTLHYIEYAFSSSLMAMVMAVNVGITELFAVTGMYVAFFSMNMLGGCVEIMSHYAGRIPADSYTQYYRFVWSMHAAAWGIFFAAMVPIWTQLQLIITCSDGNTPLYGIVAIAMESILFGMFGALQIYSVHKKLEYFRPLTKAQQTIESESLKKRDKDPDPEHLFFCDCWHVFLSLFAKIFLAWLLMGPAASVNIDEMKKDIFRYTNETMNS
jgi:hypothetical protein